MFFKPFICVIISWILCNWRKITSTLSFLVFSLFSFGQTISGRIYNQETGEQLIGATVGLKGLTIGVSTDTAGNYLLPVKEAGVYNIEARYVGYFIKVIPEIQIKNRHVMNLDIGLTPNFNGLDSLMITDKALIVQPGRLILTEEQLNRFAATYYDPARMATTSSDVIIANDQNNQVSVRGIDPSFNVWRLEGAEILNPNHLSNAGTFSDQATSNGGGVNILSAQMMRRSSFDYGAFGPELGNSVGGIFNMYIKDGSGESGHVAQASLIGLDLASQGEVNQNEKWTYAANYRYSFTGLLTNFGVDFGGEKIGFQDLSFSTKYQINRKTSIKLFALGGLNFNRFEGQPLDQSEDQKDRLNIDFEGQMGAVGARINHQSQGFELASTLLFSANENMRDQEFKNDADEIDNTSGSTDIRKLLSYSVEIRKNLKGHQFQVGAMTNFYIYDFETRFNPVVGNSFSLAINDKTEVLVQPYFNYSRQLLGTLFLKIGGNIPWNVNGQVQFDPRVQLTYFLKRNQSLAFASGRYSQLLNADNYYYYNPFRTDIRLSNLDVDYDFLSSWRHTLSYTIQSELVNTSIELFHYQFSNPLTTMFSLPSDLRKACTSGVSLQLDRSFDNQFYARIGGTFFRSLLDPEIATHQYDNRFSSSLALGREWKLKSGKRTALNLRGIYQGGVHYPGLGIFGDIPENVPYQTKDYLRFDLRWQLLNNHGKWTSTFSIDIQNILNRENEAFRYFDTFTNDVATQYQLGMIPILTYRVEF